MPLPDLIEIVPLDRPVKAEITVPGSKSITNRALILAALADGEVTLKGALWSEDTQVMTDCLQKLGFAIAVKPDPDEFCNRTITVQGLGGKIPNGGTADEPLELFVGNAGTAARFLSAFVCLGHGVYRLSGVPRMHERPQAALFKALRGLGYQVESSNDKLPAAVFGGRRRGNESQTEDESQRLLTSSPTAKRSCTVSIEESSQFASALLLCAKIGNWEVKIVGENAEESPYVAMTSKMIDAFPKNGGDFQIEPDASSGSYFWGVAWLLKDIEWQKYLLSEPHKKPGRPDFSKIKIRNWPQSGWQIDEDFTIFVNDNSGGMPIEISRNHDLGDSIMTAIVLSPVQWFGRNNQIKFMHLGRLRVQETERIFALKTELGRCGAKIIEEGDTLTVYPSELQGAEIETYNDHRMAMCFAILGLKVPGIKIKNPACVKKTFPNFFQKLAAAPPAGLGAEIWEIKNGARTRKLSGDDLFAE